ncbi:MAG: copper amine oxidase N-terminal domain-containing protein [Ruminococcaceae bacterium]|nr:copper amine oxidase N-terminal domain-containing protein [Oscillospiraceae bacterium]
MKRFSRTKRVFSVVCCVLLLAGLCFAAGTKRVEKIDVVYNDVKIVVDGKTIDPKDANGNPVEPFIYNGTTYLPVRAVGEAVGKEVKWDSVTKTVYLGEEISTDDWISQCSPYSYSDRSGKVTTVFDVDNRYVMGGKEYTRGFVFEATNNGSFTLSNLNGIYDTLKVTAGHIDNSAHSDIYVNIYLDGVHSTSYEIEWDALPKELEIPLNGALQLKIEVVGTDMYSHLGMFNGKFE